MLLPVGNSETSSSNQAERARLDVSAVGIWSTFERTFLDVRVVHVNSPSYMDKTPEQIYLQHEREKKRTYNHRILEIEKGTFTPLVYSTTGGMGPECTIYHKRIAELLSVKRGEAYADVINFIRTRIRFSLLKSTLIAVRGVRGKSRRGESSFTDTSLNLVPCRETYEVWVKQWREGGRRRRRQWSMQQTDIDLCWWRINEGGEICECVLFFYVYSVKKTMYRTHFFNGIRRY